jgi:hypothetical protein
VQSQQYAELIGSAGLSVCLLSAYNTQHILNGGRLVAAAVFCRQGFSPPIKSKELHALPSKLPQPPSGLTAISIQFLFPDTMVIVYLPATTNERYEAR